MSNQTFDEAQHPRETGGQFATKAVGRPPAAWTRWPLPPSPRLRCPRPGPQRSTVRCMLRARQAVARLDYLRGIRKLSARATAFFVGKHELQRVEVPVGSGAPFQFVKFLLFAKRTDGGAGESQRSHARAPETIDSGPLESSYRGQRLRREHTW